MFKICEVCGKAFEVNEKIVTERRRKYCSEECAKKVHLKQIRSYSTAHRKPPKNVECVICGKVFLTNRPLKVTCGPECQHKRKNALRNERRHTQAEIYKEEQRGEAVQARKQKQIASVEDMQRQAREAGMSYGQYTAMLYMQKEGMRNGNKTRC